MYKVINLFVLSVALVACGGGEEKKQNGAVQKTPAAAKTQEQKGIPGVKTIDWEQAQKLAEAGGLFVDVRSPDELMKGYVPNAINIPMYDLAKRLDELPKDRDLLIYCRSGRRSEASSNLLMKRGFTRVYNVGGGFLAYPQQKK